MRFGGLNFSTPVVAAIGCITDTRRNNKSYVLADLLGTGFAIFSLKHSSLPRFGNSIQYEKKICGQCYMCALPNKINYAKIYIIVYNNYRNICYFQT
ncbi:MAG: hypothetical protein ACI8RP_001137 [Urechidicola sp.]|jgi:hypothetical protein